MGFGLGCWQNQGYCKKLLKIIFEKTIKFENMKVFELSMQIRIRKNFSYLFETHCEFTR